MLLPSTGNICMQVALVFILPPFLFLTLILSYLTLILSYIPYTYLRIITQVAHLFSYPCKFCFFLRFNIRRYFHHHGYSTTAIQPALTQHPLRCMFLVRTMRWTLGRCTIIGTWCMRWRFWHHTYVCVSQYQMQPMIQLRPQSTIFSISLLQSFIPDLKSDFRCFS